MSANGRKTRQLGSLFSFFFVGAVVYPARQRKTDTKAAKAGHPIKDASSSGQGSACTKEAGVVCLFPVMVVLIVKPHVPSGATSKRAISALGRDGCSCHGAHPLF